MEKQTTAYKYKEQETSVNSQLTHHKWQAKLLQPNDVEFKSGLGLLVLNLTNDIKNKMKNSGVPLKQISFTSKLKRPQRSKRIKKYFSH